MFLFHCLKNMLKAKKFGAIIYLIVSAVLNIILFWAIYEKLFKQPNGIITGICVYIVALFALSTPLSNKVYEILFVNKDSIKNDFTCLQTRKLFNSIVSNYAANGQKKAKRINLVIQDAQSIADPLDICTFGNSRLAVNELADDLPQEINIGRLAFGIEAILYGDGEPNAIVLATNIFYILVLFVFMLVRNFCNKFYRLTIFKFMEKINDFENQNFIYPILFFPIKIGLKICQFKLYENFIKELPQSLYSEQIEAFLNQYLNSKNI